MKTLFIFTMLFCFSLHAKRVAPPEIKPLQKSGNEFSFEISNSPCSDVKNTCGMKVTLVSKKISVNSVNWKRELYIKMYDSKLETDVQDVHPQSLKFLNNNIIQVKDENGTEYQINALSGKMIKPLKTVIYNAFSH